MKKYRLIAVGIVILALIVTACGGDDDDTASSSDSSSDSGQTTVKLAHLAALTGNIAAANEAQVRGMDLALEEANATGKYKIEIDRKDTGADPAKAVGLMRENANDPDVMLQFGPAASSEFFAAVPLAEGLKLPTYSFIAGGTYPGEYSEWTWNSGLPEEAAIPGLIDYAEQQDAKKIGVLYAGDLDFGKTAAESFTEAAEKAKMDVTSESFNSTDVSFSAQVSKVKAADPDLVYIATVPQQAGFVLKAIRDGGITVPTMSTDNSVGNHQLVADNSQGATDGHVIVAGFDPFSDRAMVKDYQTAFKAKYPDKAIAQDPYAYDGVMIVKQALESIDGEVTREKVKDAMSKVSIEGVTGTKISFPDGHGVAEREGLVTYQLTSTGDIAPLA